MSVITTTNAFGTLLDCGFGNPVQIMIGCEGPSCIVLSTYPELTCTTDAITTNMQCKNGITCSGPSNFISKFELSQNGIVVTTNQNLTIDGDNFQLTDDGKGHVQRGSTGESNYSVTSTTTLIPPQLSSKSMTFNISPTSLSNILTSTAHPITVSTQPLNYTNSKTIAIPTYTNNSNKLKSFSKLFLGLAILFTFITQTCAHPTGQLQSTTLTLSPLIFSLFLSLSSSAQTTCGITRTIGVTTPYYNN